MSRRPVPEDFLPLHALEFQILLALCRDSMHAYAIVRNIEESQPDWSTILPTNLYRRIWRLSDEGLIEEIPDKGETDRQRRYFAITNLGRRVASAEATRLRRLLRSAQQVGVIPDAGSGR